MPDAVEPLLCWYFGEENEEYRMPAGRVVVLREANSTPQLWVAYYDPPLCNTPQFLVYERELWL